MSDNLMEQVVSAANVERALRAVIRNKGAPGIDKMTTAQLENHVQQHWESIREKLLAGKWTPSPVRLVEIAKDGGGTRRLGIPTVMDRWIQKMLLGVLEPLFEPSMSEHSYGFRPGRSQHDAVKAAQRYVQEGKSWVVDIDIKAFFDHVNHDILLHKLGQVIQDKRVLRLIGRYLRAGIMINGVVRESEEGTPQGSPLSPLLSNIYLDALDQELARRKLSFCRYADDCNIYVSSPRSAERVMANMSEWLSKELRLQINAEKSATGRPWERGYLGFSIERDGNISLAKRSIEKLKDKVREYWRSCQSRSSEQLRDDWRAYLRGWWNYFRLVQVRRPLKALSGWIRRHIRKCFWLRWHSAKGRYNALRRLGITGQLLKTAGSTRGAWRIAASGALQKALNNARLRRHGFLTPADLCDA